MFVWHTNAQVVAQKIGNNPTIISPSAVLEVESTTKGVILPRLANTAAVVAPANGMIIYDISDNCLKAYENGAWSSCLSSGGASNAAQAVSNDCSNTAFSFQTSIAGTFVLTIKNNTWSVLSPTFQTTDLALTGDTTGYTVSAVSPASATLQAGASVAVTYTITKTTAAHDGTITATWSKLGLTCEDGTTQSGVVQPRGSTFTNHFNGITSEISTNQNLVTYTTGETFSTNTQAAGKYISAQHTAATCNGSVTGASGTVYPLVLINGQCWFKTNLNEIPSNRILPLVFTAADDNIFYSYYGSAATEPAAGEGLLYTWAAAMNGQGEERSQGACPTGFHVPSDAEWMYLEHGLGMSLSQQASTAWRSNSNDNQGSPGAKLRAAGTGALDSSGFKALLAGIYNHGGSGWTERGSATFFWTSTTSSTSAGIAHTLRSGQLGVYRLAQPYHQWFSVRCLKD